MFHSLFKKSLKKLFNRIGYNITAVPKTTNFKLNGEYDTEAYYRQEGRRFEWLKKYGITNIIDIGANEGQFASKILTIFPESDIHCFEPLQDVFNKLQTTFKSKPNAYLYNLGLGMNSEETQIFRNENSASSSLLDMLDLHKSNFCYAIEVVSERITVRRLDEIFPSEIKKPLLIKIDVQGYEMYVIKGGVSVIHQADVIIIETSFYPLYDGQPLFADIYDYFKKIGFTYLGNIEQLTAPIDQQVLQADAIFAKNP